MKFDQSDLSHGGREVPSTRQSQKEATRRSLLRAARACFLTDGVTKTNFDDIAARAGVSRATVYLHFSSKEQLLMGLLEEDWAVQVQLFEGLSDTAGAADDFALWLRQVSERYRARSQSMGLYALALAQNPEMSDLIDRQRQRLVAALGQKFAAFAPADGAPLDRCVDAELMVIQIEHVCLMAARSRWAHAIDAGIALVSQRLAAFVAQG